MNLLTRIQEHPNQISPSVHDTAWLAWLYPEALDWLIDAQKPDGSWGAELEYYHDRVISTLSALNALAATSTNGHHLARIERGLGYLRRAIPRLAEDVIETGSFELLLFGLIEKGKNLGLPYNFAIGAEQVELHRQKLALIPDALIYSPTVMLPHSLEFIGFDRLDRAAIAGVRSASNGSIHNSPAATAFVEIAGGTTPAGQRYLRGLLDKYQGAAPSMYPFEMFEIIWSLYPLLLAGQLDNQAQPLIEMLAAAWHKESGVGISHNFIPDPDDTSIGFLLLSRLGQRPDPKVFEYYETKKHFRCYPLERNISLDIHTHILEALKVTPPFSRRQVLMAKALKVVSNYLAERDYLVDKWHVSPYYSTAHVVIALSGLADTLLKRQIAWLLKTQWADGRWTFYPAYPGAAVEETAHTLLALTAVYENGGDIPLTAIERGYRYLAGHYQTAAVLPSLWINKNLYNPYHIVDATVLAALEKCRRLSGKKAS